MKNVLLERDLAYKEMDLNKFENHPARKILLSLNVKEPILDIGCGNGNLLSMYSLKDNLGIDPSLYAKKLCKKKNIKVVLTDFDHFKSARKFESIFCFGLISYLEDTNGFFRKVNKFLKKDGRIYLSFQNRKSLKSILGLTKPDCKKYFIPSIKELKIILNKNGLKMEKCYGLGRIKVPFLSDVNLCVIKSIK